MACEAYVGVVVQIVTSLYHTVFSGAGDRLAQKMSLYFGLYEYIKVYDSMLSVLVCTCVYCDRLYL